MPGSPAKVRAFTLMEVLIASTVLSLCVLAITQLVSSGQMQTYDALHRDRAIALAEALLEEMIALPYADPEGAEALGPDAGETGRSTFDNIDDFHGYAETLGHAVDVAGQAYATPFHRFSRSVSCQGTTVSLGGLDVEGLSASVTVQDESGRQWSVTRFFPRPTS
jgi:prepilin-type N-terminal cleavage/methylation domain-containing protein